MNLVRFLNRFTTPLKRLYMIITSEGVLNIPVQQQFATKLVYRLDNNCLDRGFLLPIVKKFRQKRLCNSHLRESGCRQSAA
jgi:hypothetical protein